MVLSSKAAAAFFCNLPMLMNIKTRLSKIFLNILLDISQKNGFDLTRMQNCLFSCSKE